MMNPTSKIFLFLVFFLGIIFVWENAKADCTGTGPNWVSTADVASVGACVAKAATGDTITIHGNAVWNSGLTLPDSKGLHLIGSGTPVITRGDSYSNALIFWNPSSDLPLRISGFRFDNGTNNGTERRAIYIRGNNNGLFGLTQVRIDHNYFNKGRHAVFFAYWVEGLVDNNIFDNCDVAVMLAGDYSNSWAREIKAGTKHANFIEDNLFLADNNQDVHLNEQIYHQSGARSVIRHNTFDLSAATTSLTVAFIDSHGNWGTTGNPLMYRGQPLIEIHDNIMKAHSSTQLPAKFMDFRGGSVLVYNNSLYLSAGANYGITLWEEDGWTYGGPYCPDCPVLTAWPAHDQIFNSFFWNNHTYFNGSVEPALLDHIHYNHEDTDGIFIQEGRDYFMHEPHISGGKETLHSHDTIDMTFSSSGANAYYPYTSYTYPHPLRAGDDTTPPAEPSALTVQ